MILWNVACAFVLLIATGCTNDKMDRAGLQLQNLNYEKTHIQNEIERCQNAQYLYEGIDLVDEDEFRRAAAPELLEYADEHQLMHNRLQHELAERKRYQLLHLK